MWVFCCGMYRSASTLQFQITARLVKEAGIGQQLGWIDANRFPQVRETYSDQTGMNVIKVHLCTLSMRMEFERHNAVAIYTYRDLRDVYASYMKQWQCSFYVLWKEKFIKGCLDDFKNWTTLPNALVSKYEEVIQDIATEAKRISHHLQLNFQPDFYQEVADDYALESQKKRIREVEKKLSKISNLNPAWSRADYYDKDNLLHINHIDSAKSGRWRDDLSVQEVELIETEVRNWCQENNYLSSHFLYS